MNIPAYLERIGYHGSTAPTLETLRALQRAHMQTVPFENLDIARGTAIVLDEGRLLDKIVTRRRGGFCYELNGAFAALLRALGYPVEYLNARVANAQGVFGIPFDHLALRVTLDEPWLVDVGFGDSFNEPLRLLESGEQVRGGMAYRLDNEGDECVLMRMEEGGWKPQYRFPPEAYQLADFAGGCHFHQTSPESPFTRRRVCTRATADGRITLSGLKLVMTRNGEKQEQVLNDEAEVSRALREHFGIAFD